MASRIHCQGKSFEQNYHNLKLGVWYIEVGKKISFSFLTKKKLIQDNIRNIKMACWALFVFWLLIFDYGLL